MKSEPARGGGEEASMAGCYRLWAPSERALDHGPGGGKVAFSGGLGNFS